ncbi:MAG TPA: immunoglobulin domain-containing protein [Chitinispirillaceae bacterium]|nr:immunoglobulin domain-containing protein [Chitinispirillaceae bacterium]
MSSSRFIKAILFLLPLTFIIFLFCGEIPSDSVDQSNAKFSPFIIIADSTIYEGSILDTVGKPVTFCAELFLPDNFDSIGITVTLENQTIADTVLRQYVSAEFFDTLKMTYTFTAPGNYLVTFTPYTSLAIKPVTLTVVMLPPPNRQPVITVSGITVLRPGETCTLLLQTSDPDSGQILTPSIKGQPQGSTFLNNTFTWLIPSGFTGLDTIEFSVTDNGIPPLCSTKTVILTVTNEIINRAPLWNDDTLNFIIDDTSACSISLSDRCIDADGDILTFFLLQRAPDSDSIKDGLYYFKATPSSIGTWYPAIVAVDPDSACDTLYIKMTVAKEVLNSAPLWNDDTLNVVLDDTSACFISLSDKCIDADGDILTFHLLQRTPDSDSIKDGLYHFKATPSSVGTWYPAILAEDPDGASDTLYIKMVVNQLQSSSAQLASIAFSAGTLREKTAPVPDTINDTVSYNDSTLTLSFTLFNNQSSIAFKGELLPQGTTSASVSLSVGVNEYSLTVKSPDNSMSKDYLVIIVRKQNSIVQLTTPPSGLRIDSTSTTLIRIKWDDLSNATSYTVERSKMNTENFTAVDTMGNNFFIDTGLESGVVYFYRVNASNAAGSTEFCAAVGCTTMVKPSMTAQPKDTTVVIGSSLTLNCTVSGSAVQIQWRRNNIDLPGKTTESLGFTAVTMADTGVYTIKAWNSADSVLSLPFRLGVLPAKPQEVTAVARSAFSAGVSWTGSDGAACYIVLRSIGNGSATAVCTTSERSIVDTMLTEGAAYKYFVLANNAFGNSDTAKSSGFSTWKGPVLTTDLNTTLTIAEGNTIRLSVVATGVPQCTYQWKKNGNPISGATSNELVIDPAYSADSGAYMVVVTNSVRSVNSKQVKVSVLSFYSLDVTISPAVGGTVTRVKDTVAYLYGSTVALTANPASGYRFGGWSGDTSATGTTLNLVMKKNRAVTANFVRQYNLKFSVSGNGTTTPTAGTSMYVDSGEVVNITASAKSGNKFKQWTSAQSGVVFGNPSAANTTVKLTQGNATVQAAFGCVTFSKTLPLSEYEYVYLSNAIPAVDSGYMIAASAENDGIVIRLNNAGEVLYKKSNGVGFQEFNFISQSGSGYVVAGYSYSKALFCGLAQNLNLSWYKFSGVEDTRAVLARQTSDNGHMFAIYANGGYDLNIQKTNSVGDSSWATLLESGSMGSFRDLQQTSDGGFLIGGTTNAGGECRCNKNK